MSAIPIQLAALAPVDLAGFIAIDEAAELLGKDQANLRRRCRDDLSTHGLARLATPPGGGNPKWFIDRGYDARLAAGPIGERYQQPDLTLYSDRQRRQATQRAACAMRLGKAIAWESGKTSHWLPTLIAELRREYPELRISRTSLYAWHSLYRRPADILNLIDRRGQASGGDGDDEAWGAFKDLYQHQNRPTLKQCWREVARMAELSGWQWCGLASCYRQLDGRIPELERLQARDPVTYRQRMLPTIEQDPESWPARVCWIGDHHQLNVWCLWNDTIIRPWFTGWMDWRTRRLAGWVMSDSPNSSTILAVLDHGLGDEQNLGGPDTLWIDNGRDYDAWIYHGQTKQERLSKIKPALDEPMAKGLFGMLQIEPHFSLAYNPNGKARIERWFGTLEAFYRTTNTYAGNCPEARPERLKYVLSKRRMIPTFADVYEELREHIAGYNARSEHEIDDLVDGGERLSLDEAMRRWAPNRRVMADPSARKLLLQFWREPVAVGKNGIAVSLRGRTFHYGQFAPELRPFTALHKEDRRKVVVAYNPHDVRKVQIYTTDLKFIVEVGMNELGGLHDGSAISQGKISELIRQQREYALATKHRAAYEITAIRTNEQHLAEIAAMRPAPAAEPMTSKLIITPLDGQPKEVARQQLRRAVGDGTPEPSADLIFDKMNAARERDRSGRSERRRMENEEISTSDLWAKRLEQDHGREQ